MSTGKRIKLSKYRLTIPRHIMQFLSFILINYVILEFIFSINLKGLENFIKILPILASPNNPLSKGAGFGEYIFFFMVEGSFPFFILAIFLLIVLFSNRFFCGWICPIGTIQDALSSIPSKKKAFNMNWHNSLLNLKYLIILFLLFLLVPLGFSKTIDRAFYRDYKGSLGKIAENPFGYFSLSEYIFVTFPKMFDELWNAAKLDPLLEFGWILVLYAFYLVVIVCSVYYPRFYCKYLCPFGAMMAAVNDYSFLKLSRSPVKCVGRTECGVCEKICPHQIRILDEPFEFFAGKGECIFCLKCLESCPYNAIDITFG